MSAIDNLLPQHSPIPAPKALYNLYPIGHYAFDGHYNSMTGSTVNFGNMTGIPWLLNTLLSGVFQLETLATKMVIYMIQWAFGLQIVKPMAGPIGGFVGAMQNAFFGPSLDLAFIALGIWLLMTVMVRRRGAEGAGGVAKAFVVLAVAIGLFANMGTVLTQATDLAGQMSTGILHTAAVADPQAGKAGGGANGALVSAGNQIWQTFVVTPWQLGEFGNYRGTQIQQHTAEVLALSPTSTTRITDTRNWAGGSVGWPCNAKVGQLLQQCTAASTVTYPSMTAAGLVSRLVVVAAVFVIGTIFGISMVVLAGSLLMTQFLLLILAMISPVVFILGLWPGKGTEIVLKWAGKCFAAVFYRVLISLFLSAYLVLAALLYTAMGGYGWLVLALLQLVLLLTIIFERYQIMALLMVPANRSAEMFTVAAILSGYRKMASMGAGGVQQVRQGLRHIPPPRFTPPQGPPPPPRPNSVVPPAGTAAPGGTAYLAEPGGTPPKQNPPNPSGPSVLPPPASPAPTSMAHLGTPGGQPPKPAPPAPTGRSVVPPAGSPPPTPMAHLGTPGGQPPKPAPPAPTGRSVVPPTGSPPPRGMSHLAPPPAPTGGGNQSSPPPPAPTPKPPVPAPTPPFPPPSMDR